MRNHCNRVGYQAYNVNLFREMGLMPMPRKPTPEKYCKACGEQLVRKRWKNGKLESLLHFGRRKFCDQKCMGRAFRGREHTDDPKDPERVGRYRAQQMADAMECERCGATENLDVHHKDEDPTNNDPENLEVLCRSCHTRHHRARTCSLPDCSGRHKGHGYCVKHYQRWKKWGDPHLVKPNQHTPLQYRED